MAEDNVMPWLSRLRELRDPNTHVMVNDRHMLIVAEMFGSIDPFSLEPMSPRYASLDSISDSQVVSILDGLAEQLDSVRASPGEAVGVIAGTSIAEPFTQAILRSFLYAGVSAQSAVGPEKALTIAVDHLPNPYHRMCIALRPDIKFSESKADAVLRKIKRHRLGEFCTVSVNSPLNELGDEAGKLHDWLITSELEWDDPERVEVRERWRSLLDEMVDRRNEMFESKQIIVAMKSMAGVVNEKGDLIIPHGWVVDYEDENGNVVLKPIMDMSMVREALIRAMQTTKGKYKTTKHIPDLYTSVRFSDSGDDLLVTWPRLHHRHILQISQLITDLELCGGCYSCLKTYKLQPLPRTADKNIPITDPLDKEKLTTVEKYYEKILYDPTAGNPPEENPHLGYGYSVGMGAEGIDRYLFTLQEVTHSRVCVECGGGWWNTVGALFQLGGAASYEEDWGEYDEEGAGREAGLVHSWGSMTTLNHSVPEGLDPTDPSNWFFTDYQAQQRVSYPYSRPGAHSDIPISYMHSGRLPLSPEFGEWFVIATYADPLALSQDGFKWGESKKKDAAPPGHFINAMKLKECDQSRTSTDDVQQTFHVLGIEAARIVLFQNLYNTLSGGNLMAGADFPVSLSHYMLMADSMCEGPLIRGAPAGRGSRVGVASTKGDGKAVLSIAYEQEVNVLMEAAVLGITDPLLSPKSAQIAGVSTPVGSGWDKKGGRFAETISLEIDFLRSSVQIASDELQRYALSEHGIYWYDSDDDDVEGYGVSDLTNLRRDSPLFSELNSKREILLADSKFVEIYNHWVEKIGEYQSMLEENFDSRGTPIKPGELPYYGIPNSPGYDENGKRKRV